MTVTIHQAKTHLSRLLQQVQLGEQVTVCRGKQPIAKLVPADSVRAARPKVGIPTSPRFTVPEDAFVPLSEDDLRNWGV
jgi:prevent-host-death family protein